MTPSWPPPTTSSWCCRRGRGVRVRVTPCAPCSGQAASAAAALHPAGPTRRGAAALAGGVAALLDARRPGSDLQLALAKAFPNAAEDARGADRLAGWLDRGRRPRRGRDRSPNCAGRSVLNLARLGRLDEAAIDAEADRDTPITGAEQAAAARRPGRPPRPRPRPGGWPWRPTACPTGPSGRSAWPSGSAARITAGAVHGPLLPARPGRSPRRGRLGPEGVRAAGERAALPVPWPVDKQALLERLDAWLATAELSSSVRRLIVEGRDNRLRALRCQSA